MVASSKSAILNCPMCGRELKTKQLRTAHLKKCARELKVPPTQVMSLVRKQEEEAQLLKIAESSEPKREVKRKRTTKPRVAAKQPRNQLEADTHLAKALSRSTNPEAPRKNNRKKAGDVPQLVLQDKEELGKRWAKTIERILLEKNNIIVPGVPEVDSSLKPLAERCKARAVKKTSRTANNKDNCSAHSKAERNSLWNLQASECAANIKEPMCKCSDAKHYTLPWLRKYSTSNSRVHSESQLQEETLTQTFLSGLAAEAGHDMTFTQPTVSDDLNSTQVVLRNAHASFHSLLRNLGDDDVVDDEIDNALQEDEVVAWLQESDLSDGGNADTETVSTEDDHFEPHESEEILSDHDLMRDEKMSNCSKTLLVNEVKSNDCMKASIPENINSGSKYVSVAGSRLTAAKCGHSRSSSESSPISESFDSASLPTAANGSESSHSLKATCPSKNAVSSGVSNIKSFDVMLGVTPFFKAGARMKRTLKTKKKWLMTPAPVEARVLVVDSSDSETEASNHTDSISWSTHDTCQSTVSEVTYSCDKSTASSDVSKTQYSLQRANQLSDSVESRSNNNQRVIPLVETQCTSADGMSGDDQTVVNTESSECGNGIGSECGEYSIIVLDSDSDMFDECTSEKAAGCTSKSELQDNSLANTKDSSRAQQLHDNQTYTELYVDDTVVENPSKMCGKESQSNCDTITNRDLPNSSPHINSSSSSSAEHDTNLCGVNTFTSRNQQNISDSISDDPDELPDIDLKSSQVSTSNLSVTNSLTNESRRSRAVSNSSPHRTCSSFMNKSDSRKSDILKESSPVLLQFCKDATCTSQAVSSKPGTAVSVTSNLTALSSSPKSSTITNQSDSSNERTEAVSTIESFSGAVNSPGLFCSPGSIKSPGSFHCPGPTKSPVPNASPCPRESPEPSRSPGPIVSPGALGSPSPMASPGSVCSPNPLHPLGSVNTPDQLNSSNSAHSSGDIEDGVLVWGPCDKLPDLNSTFANSKLRSSAISVGGSPVASSSSDICSSQNRPMSLQSPVNDPDGSNEDDGVLCWSAPETDSFWASDNEPTEGCSTNNSSHSSQPTKTVATRKNKLKVLATPRHQYIRSSDGRTWQLPSPFTPAPDFDSMKSPDLRAAVARIGVRPQSKLRMRKILKHVYEQTHQYETDPEFSPTVRKELLGGSSGHRSQQIPQSSTPQSKQARRKGKTKRKKLVMDSDDSDDGYQISTQQRFSLGVDLPPGSNTDSEEDVCTQTKDKRTTAEEKVLKFLMDDPDLYTKILSYEPLLMNGLQTKLKQAGIRIGIQHLTDLLDSKCITFTLKDVRALQNNGRKATTFSRPKRRKK